MMNYLYGNEVYSYAEDVLSHHGILGMKWGVRRTPEQLGHKKEQAQRRKKKEITAEDYPNLKKSHIQNLNDRHTRRALTRKQRHRIAEQANKDPRSFQDARATEIMRRARTKAFRRMLLGAAVGYSVTHPVEMRIAAFRMTETAKKVGKFAANQYWKANPKHAPKMDIVDAVWHEVERSSSYVPMVIPNRRR